MKEPITLLYFSSTLTKYLSAQKLLTDEGFELVPALDLPSAIEAANRKHPTIVLLDPSTSITDFFKLRGGIRKNTKNSYTQFLLFISESSENGIDDLQSEGIFLIPTPKDTRELLQCLNTFRTAKVLSQQFPQKNLPFEEAIDFFEKELTQSRHVQRSLARQLWKERERLGSSQSVARVGSWETDLTDLTVEWTEQTHQIFGTDPTSFLPTHEEFISLVHPQDQKKVDAAFKQSIENKSSHSIVHRIVRPDGTQRIVEERWSVFTDENNKAVRAVGACRDITDQQIAEADRDRLFRLSGDLLAIGTLEGQLTQVNPAWTEALGWPKEEIENNYALKLLHPDDFERSKRTGIAIRNGENIRDFENRLLCKDGSYRWICWNTYPFLELQQVFSIGRDITDAKLAKQGLDELEERLQFISESLNLGYWDLDLITAQVWRSLSHDQCFGHEKLLDEWSYSIFLRHLHPDDRDYADRSIQATIAKGNNFKIEFRVIWPDRSVHWLFCIGRITRNKKGKAIRMLGVVLDISDRKKLEGQLHQAQRLESMGHLTGGIAHDFNNLLTIIIGNTEVLQQELKDSSELAPLTDMVFDAAERGAELVKRMLAFSRKQRLEPKTFNINELIAKLQPLLERSIGASVDLELQLLEKLWLCRIDPSELENCLLNLAINARDAMAEHGKLIISTSNKTIKLNDFSQQSELDMGDYVQIKVEDNGVGISEEILEQIFEPFFTTKPSGSGLGLAMVYGFIKQSGGGMFVQSTPDEGTQIELYIPAIHESE